VEICKLQLRRMQIPTCCRVDRSQIYRKVLRIVGTSCDSLLVPNDSDRVTVGVVDSVTVTGCSHLLLIFQGSWTRQGKGFIASFRLEPKNQGVGASLGLEPEN
jgi:hypothetical protein